METVETVVMAAAAITEPRRRTGATAGPDRASVLLFSLAAFLAVLALLAWQLQAAPTKAARTRVVVVRRIYQTTVVETIPGAGKGTAVSQSVSSSGSAAVTAAPVATRSSGH